MYITELWELNNHAKCLSHSKHWINGTVVVPVVITIIIRKHQTGHGMLKSHQIINLIPHGHLIKLKGQRSKSDTSRHLLFSWRVDSIPGPNPCLGKKNYVSKHSPESWPVQGLTVGFLVTDSLWFENSFKLTFSVLSAKSSFICVSWQRKPPSSFKHTSIRHNILEELRISVVSLNINSNLQNSSLVGKFNV